MHALCAILTSVGAVVDSPPSAQPPRPRLLNTVQVDGSIGEQDPTKGSAAAQEVNIIPVLVHTSQPTEWVDELHILGAAVRKDEGG